MTTISRYGLHWAAGIPFLMQQVAYGPTNLIDRSLSPPFRIDAHRSRICPHGIDLDFHVETPAWVRDDPLARAFWPTPKGASERVLVVVGDHDRLVHELTRICSPVQPMSRPVWFKSATAMRPVYEATNLSPIVVTGAKLDDVPSCIQHLDLANAFQRRLVIIARERIPLFGAEFDYVETDLSLDRISSEPLEQIGSGLLREHMERGQA